jgi:hypothetical protein
VAAELGPEYTLTIQEAKLNYVRPSLYFVVPVRGHWRGDVVLVARSSSEPDFAVPMLFHYDTQWAGTSAEAGRLKAELTNGTRWKQGLDRLPPRAREAFMKWWALVSPDESL